MKTNALTFLAAALLLLAPALSSPTPSDAGPVLSVAAPVFSAAAQDARDLPDADELIARYVEAIGGRDAHADPTSIRTSGAMSIPGMGLEGEFELIQIPDVGSRMNSSMPGLGEIMAGFDGEVGWSLNPMAGPQLMEGAELEHMAERTRLAATLRDPELVLERETVDEVEVDGRPCYRVRLVWASGRESFDCYSTETGRLIRSEDVQVSEMGEVPTITEFSDYREFRGMVLPTRIVQRTMGMEQVMEITSVTVDDADADDLTPPAQIRTLLEG